MPDRILTSHAGSLPRPEDLIALNERRAAGEFTDEAEYLSKLRTAVADVVARQRETGIDLVNDGEFGHSMDQRYDYGTWWTYVFQRLAGLELTTESIAEIPQPKAKPGAIRLGTFFERRDWQQFADAYADPDAGVAIPNRMHAAPLCTGPISYAGHKDVQRDIADMKAAMAAAGLSEGYLNSVAPASCARVGNEHYDNDEELMYACADAMREEYQAIIDAGLILQLDDPAIAENWDQINPAPSVEDYRRFTRHSTNVVEHPELVADRICQFADVVGRENVVASTDCGLGGRVHPQIAWAKLDTLAKGAEIATRRLWG